MTYGASEELEIICTVEKSSLTVLRTLAQSGIPRVTFYNWYGRRVAEGLDGLEYRKHSRRPAWKTVPEEVAEQLVTLAFAEPDLSLELAVLFSGQNNYYLSESSVYRILKSRDLIRALVFIMMIASDELQNPTTAQNQLWQAEITYLKVTRLGRYYLSTVMDDFSYYIIAWWLCKIMSACDVVAALQGALGAVGLWNVSVRHRLHLISDNGLCYVSSELRNCLRDSKISHARSRPSIHRLRASECWQSTLKDHMLLENHYLPGDLERQLGVFITHYNTRRYHESLTNLTPKSMSTGQRAAVLKNATTLN